MTIVGAAHEIGSDVTSSGVSTIVQQLQDELVQLLQQRDMVVQRIGTVKKVVAGLAAMFGDGAVDDGLRELVGIGAGPRVSGLTSTCRRILMEASLPMSSHEVLQRINAENPSVLARHKDPLASLTTILNRLVSYGEAQRVLLADSRRGWQWAQEARKD